jgi:hypothetical protein
VLLAVRANPHKSSQANNRLVPEYRVNEWWDSVSWDSVSLDNGRLGKIRWGFPHNKSWCQPKFLQSIFLQAVSHFHQAEVLHFRWALPISAYLLAPVVAVVVVGTVPPPVVIDLAITEEPVVQAEVWHTLILTLPHRPFQ